MKMKLSMLLFLSIFFINSYKIYSADRLASDLFQAIESQNIENFLKFLNNGVDVDTMIGVCLGRSLLSWAACLGRLDIVELLIMRGADINIQDYEGTTPLHNATFNKHIEIVRLLLQHKANPNTRNQNDTPLLAAVCSNNFELVKLLLDNKAVLEGHECNYAKSGEIRKLLGGSSCVVQ